jgi:hypothetical protein
VEGSFAHCNEPSVSIKFSKFLSGCTIGGFSRRVQPHEVSKGQCKESMTVNHDNFLNMLYMDVILH